MQRFTGALSAICEEAQKSGRKDIVAKTKSLSENREFDSKRLKI